MRVLVVHNRYSSRAPSGENLAVQDEVRWLRDAGVDVHTHEVSNDDVFEAGMAQRIGQAASALWSVPAQRRMSAILERTEPDLVHIHNLFPLLSASVPWVATRRGLPVVWTVHNHRVTCVIGTNFRDGKPCYDCRPGWRVPGIRYSCYGQSTAASALATGATSLFRSFSRRRITPVAISEHVKRWLVDTAGFPADHVQVKYNAVAEPPVAAEQLPPAADCRTFLFASHLTTHKGTSLLLDAWQRLPHLDAELRIIGDGPLADRVEASAAADERINWTGHLPTERMTMHLAQARVVVVPSAWEEPFGRTAAEALAHGRPVITTGTGGLSEIIDEDTGWITGVDASRLAFAIEEAATSDAVRKLSGNTRDRYRKIFSPEATTSALLEIYEQALKTHRSVDPGLST